MIFRSFWMAGFECSCHRRGDSRRLDVIAATGHDRFARQDYDRARRLGMETVRDGARWHLIERSPGRYDFSSLLPMVRAAREAGVQVIWDLCHYGWPDGLDVFRPEFVDRFADYAREVARLIAAETDDTPWYCPVNEISFWSWAGGTSATSIRGRRDGVSSSRHSSRGRPWRRSTPSGASIRGPASSTAIRRSTSLPIRSVRRRGPTRRGNGWPSSRPGT